MSIGYEYVDGIGNVTVTNGMAHVDLIVLVPPAAEGQAAHVLPVKHLVMPLPGFVRMCAEMANHLARMEQKGIITRNRPPTMS